MLAAYVFFSFRLSKMSCGRYCQTNSMMN